MKRRDVDHNLQGATDEVPAETWTRTLWFMVFVQFIMSAALTAPTPILPLFLPEVGIADFRAINFWSGVLTSVNFLIAAIASPLWGRWRIGTVGRRWCCVQASRSVSFQRRWDAHKICGSWSVCVHCRGLSAVFQPRPSRWSRLKYRVGTLVLLSDGLAPAS